MKAVELTAFGLHGLRVVDRPDPSPARGEVLLRIQTASLNHRDLEIMEGRYGMPVSLPVVPLSDAVGEVLALGPEVVDLKVGDRVCPTFFPEWLDGPFQESYLSHQAGGNVDGVLSEMVRLPASAVVKAPAHLGPEAAALPLAALTAWSALTDAAVGPGQRVLAIGTGGVSLFVLQLAPLFGAEVLVVSSDEEALVRASKLGAAAMVNRNEHPAWGARVRELTAGAGVDLVVDVAGAATFDQLPAALRIGGTVAMVGYASGPTLQFDMRSLFIARRARLHGHTIGSRRQLEQMFRAIEQHRLVPVVDCCFDLCSAGAAYERLASRRAFGKVLVSI
jgi:NADPH:quinone reductase-like Zn-dependent oxidoreductase